MGKRCTRVAWYRFAGRSGEHADRLAGSAGHVRRRRPRLCGDVHRGGMTWGTFLLYRVVGFGQATLTVTSPDFQRYSGR